MIDTDGSMEISLSEFKKALRDFKMDNLQDQEAHMLFNMIDLDHDGSINYKEFIRTIRVSSNYLS
jgi:Ca2+-binding EF-hand superfamily protein